MKKLSLLFVAILTIFVYSCSPSVEGETKSWDSNVQQLKKMQTDYPAYAEMISSKLSEAEKVYKSAEGISDEDAKAEKMREANNILSSGCVGNLKNMLSKIDDVDRKKSELRKAAKTKSDMKYAESVIDDAKSAVKKAEKVLNKKAEDLDANPCVKIERAYKKLETAYSDMTSAISSFRSAESKKNKKDKKKEEQLKNDVKKKEEAAKPIKCEYCGTKNKAGSTKCKSCGANL